MTNSRLILALCASLTALAFGTANAQTIYHSDGTTTTIIGNTAYHSDGSTSTQIGDTTYHSDGSTTSRVGTLITIPTVLRARALAILFITLMAL